MKHRLPASDVEPVLTGQPEGNGAHRELTAVISALRDLPAPVGAPAAEEQAVSAFMDNRIRPTHPRRTPVITRILASKLATSAVAATIASAGGVAAAAGGVLPTPAQNFVSSAAEHIGVSLPSDTTTTTTLLRVASGQTTPPSTTTTAPPATGTATSRSACPTGASITSMDATITSDDKGVVVTIQTSGTFPYMSAGGTGWTGTVSAVPGGFSGTLTRTDGSSVVPGTAVAAGSCGVRASTLAHYPGQKAPTEPSGTSSGQTTPPSTTTTAPPATGTATSRSACPTGASITSMDATITSDDKGVVVTIQTSGTFPYMSAGGTGWTGTVSAVPGGFSGTLTRTDGSSVVPGTAVAAGSCGVRASTLAHYPGQKAPTEPSGTSSGQTTPPSTTTTAPPATGTATSRSACPTGASITSMDATITSDDKGVVVTIQTSGTFPYMSAGGTGWTGTVSAVPGGFSGTLTRTDGSSVVPGTAVAAGSCGVRASTLAHS